jgi:hypothetical protein
MTGKDAQDSTPPRFWASPRLSWGLVIFGLALLLSSHIPSLPEQLAQCRQGMTPQNLKLLGYLIAISTFPVAGLWRLSAPLGLPRILAFLYPLFPIAIIAVYLIKPLLDRVRPRR